MNDTNATASGASHGRESGGGPEAFSIGDAAELIASLTSPAPSEPFSLFRVQPDGSRREFPLRMRLLREEETIDCLREAQAYAKANAEIPAQYGDIYREAQAVAVIARTLCHSKPRRMVGASGAQDGPEYYPQLFTSSAQLRASFMSDEIAACLNGYEVVKAKYRCLESFSADEIDKWAARLSDAMLGPLFLGRLDSSHWPALLTCLAQRVQSLSESLGLQLSTSPDSSESSPDTSDAGTGGSTPSPSVVTSDGETLPQDRLLSKEEADALVRARKQT